MASFLQTRTARKVKFTGFAILLLALIAIWSLPGVPFVFRLAVTAVVIVLCILNKAWVVWIAMRLFDRRPKSTVRLSDCIFCGASRPDLFAGSEYCICSACIRSAIRSTADNANEQPEALCSFCLSSRSHNFFSKDDIRICVNCLTEFNKHISPTGNGVMPG